MRKSKKNHNPNEKTNKNHYPNGENREKRQTQMRKLKEKTEQKWGENRMRWNKQYPNERIGK